MKCLKPIGQENKAKNKLLLLKIINKNKILEIKKIFENLLSHHSYYHHL